MTDAAALRSDEAALVAASGEQTSSDRQAGAERKARARRLMLTGPVLPTLVMLALPTIGVMVAQSAVTVAEAYYVGLLGNDALAAAAMVYPMFMLMMTMSNGGLGSGVASSVARAIGANRQKDADALVFHSILLAILFGAAFTIGIVGFGRPLFVALGGRDASLEAALQYSAWLFAASIPVWIVNLIASALRGSGNVKVPALVTLIGALITIPVSPALIFGLGPIPRLGIAGAGVAFGAYYTAAMVVMLRYMRSGRSGLSLSIVPLDSRLLADILRVGLPTAVNTVQTNLCVILVTGAVGLFGVNALAGYGIAARLDYIMIPILFGLSSALLAMVGINVGAGNGPRARHIAWVAAAIGVFVTGAIGLGAAIVPRAWAGLFTNDAEVLAAAASYLRIVGFAYGLFGFGFVVSFAGQGASRVFWPSLAVSARLLVAAGIGWAIVKFAGGGLTDLALVVAASFAAYAGLASITLLSGRVWRLRKA